MLPSLETNLPTLPAPVMMPVSQAMESGALRQAFEWFSDTAASLERSYAQLQAEVARLNKELQGKQDELEQEREAVRKANALAQVSAVLAHEIRNPLASMELFTDLLLDCGLLQGEPLLWLNQLQAGLRTLTATVNNVLQLHSGGSVSLLPLCANDVLDSAAQFLAPIARQRNVEMVVEGSSDGARLKADRHRLHQVLLNLAMNAFRAMPDGGTLTLAAGSVCQVGCKAIELRVEDTGTGIPAENFSRIFEAGFTTRPDGVGLGLAVCKKIVEEHGGSIRVESTCNEGSAFILRFPAL